MSDYHARMVGEEMGLLHERIAELEAALTDALTGWGLLHGADECRELLERIKNYDEAVEHIQRARLALPKAQEATQ